MRVSVLYFGVLKERAGAATEEIEVQDGATVGSLLVLLQARPSNMRMELPMWSSVAVAVNREYSSPSDILHEGDEVALLPPVSGGYCAYGEERASLAKVAVPQMARRSRCSRNGPSKERTA
jgi:molybdopterin converting factor subunit 1